MDRRDACHGNVERHPENEARMLCLMGAIVIVIYSFVLYDHRNDPRLADPELVMLMARAH